MLAWHFCRSDMRLGNGDGRQIVVGETLVHDGVLELCEQGLHASRLLLDALEWAPGPIICRVRLGGEIVEGDDKLVATERTVLWCVDGEELLHRFARRCALDVVHLWAAPDGVLRWLRTGDESLRGAAWDDAWDAAWDAAWATAWAAAKAAAKAAARATAWDAARVNAQSAARDAARRRQNRRLTSMVCAARRRV